MADGMSNGDMAKYAILVITVAAIVLAGMAITAQYSETLRTTTGPVDFPVLTLGAVNVSVATGSAYPFVQSLVNCTNDTLAGDAAVTANQLDASYYRIDEGNADGGFITINDAGAAAGWNAVDINCSGGLTYLADSDTQGYADKFTAGLAIFGTFIAIIILSIVGKIIVGIFKKNK